MVSLPESGVRSPALPHAGATRPPLRPDVWSLSTEALDALDSLGEEIVRLSARIEADTQRLLGLIAEFDARQGWELSGHRGCAEWLAAFTGIDLGAARERVRTARALADLPLLRASMGRGELSFSKLRALTRIATPENEEELLPLARDSTAAQLERIVRCWRPPGANAATDREREERRHEARELSLFPDLDGMIQIRGRLTPEIGALLMKAIEAASDTLYREAAAEALGSERDRRRRAAQRRADALGLLAERALEAGLGGPAGDGVHDDPQAETAEGVTGAGTGAATEGAEEGRGRDAPERTPEGAAEGTAKGSTGKSARPCEGPRGSTRARADRHGGPPRPLRRRTSSPHPPVRSGSRAERYQVILHMGVETGTGATAMHPSGPRSEIEPGIRVSAETSRRIACDAGVVRVTHAPDGTILDVGRRTRAIPPALRRALEVRDRGCRFPGCPSRFCEGHHIRHWADGGETSLGNTLLLCRHHHRLVHEGGWTLEHAADGRPVFRSPRGEVVRDFRSSPIASGPVAGGTHGRPQWRKESTNGGPQRRREGTNGGARRRQESARRPAVQGSEASAMAARPCRAGSDLCARVGSRMAPAEDETHM